MIRLRKWLIFIFILCASGSTFAQGVRVSARAKPLSDVVSDLRVSAGLSISFNQTDLNRYVITADTLFSDGESALRYLLQGIPLTLRKIDNVFVISPKTARFTISGTIMERESAERLPYTSVICDGKLYMSDVNGNFNVFSSENGARISFKYLGYRKIDTLLHAGNRHMLFMSPSHTSLREALLEEYETSNSLSAGEAAGVMRINHSVAKYLPGNGDNSVFNLLRLMPGVRAAGEAAGFSVWASKPGESTVIFDGSRLFSMNGYNEQISAVNPFMVKEIRVLKGGYGPEYGNQTGSVAQITGIGGNRKNPELKLNVNNLTANIFASAPVGEKAAVAASYRQTYYGLYDVNALNPFGKRINSDSGSQGQGQSSNKNEVFITPEYSFRDANLRFSGDINSGGKYFASLYGASDRFMYSLENEDSDLEASETNRQIAISAGVSLTHKNGASTSFSGSFSALDKQSEKVILINRANYSNIKLGNVSSDAEIRVSHIRPHSGFGIFEAGVEGTHLGVTENLDKFSAVKGALFLNERVTFKNVSIQIGARGDYYLDSLFFQPRFSVNLNLTDNFSLSGAWGVYNQFLGKVPVIYEEVAPSLVWKLLGEGGHPVAKSYHAVAGFSWSGKNMLLSAEAFNRRTQGISQIIMRNNSADVQTGSSSITGADLFLKWERRGSQVFASFTAATASEKYDDTRDYQYYPLEFKLGAVINLSPFWISAGYVYGNGYLNAFGTGRYSSLGTSNYNRLDLSATYAFAIGKSQFRTGISILNVLNSANKKTLEILPVQSRGNTGTLLNLYAESIPFTPAVYIELAL